tara:strand:- start:6049 stop:6399 length:351 start_codon:yes stop_codon:yes gene_type:complete
LKNQDEPERLSHEWHAREAEADAHRDLTAKLRQAAKDAARVEELEGEKAVHDAFHKLTVLERDCAQDGVRDHIKRHAEKDARIADLECQLRAAHQVVDLLQADMEALEADKEKSSP